MFVEAPTSRTGRVDDVARKEKRRAERGEGVGEDVDGEEAERDAEKKGSAKRCHGEEWVVLMLVVPDRHLFRCGDSKLLKKDFG